MKGLPALHAPATGILRLAAAGTIAAALAAAGCTSKSEHDRALAENQRLMSENEKLSQTIDSMKGESSEANATLAEVQKGLEDIRAKELTAIRSSLRVAEEGKASGSRRDQLQAEISTIRAAVHENLEKLARLQRSNRESGVKLASVQKLADELKRSLEEKDATVAELGKRVTELSATVESQKSTLAERDAAIHEGETKMARQTKEINTAYVAVASKDLLRKKGVVERRGDILGVGGRWIETGKFDPQVFREVDVTRDLEVSIPAPARKVRVVTSQPKESYRIVSGGPNAKYSKLEVTDPAAFWKGDRYLVVMTD
jgi:chromosome segregation ATPase